MITGSLFEVAPVDDIIFSQFQSSPSSQLELETILSTPGKDHLSKKTFSELNFIW